MWFTGAVHSNTFGVYNNDTKKKKSHNVHLQKPNTNYSVPTLDFYQVKLEIMPD